MKRITFWFLSTVSVVVLLFGYDGSGSATTSTASPPAAFSSGSSSSSSPGSSSGSTATGSGSSSGTTKKATKPPTKKAAKKAANKATVKTVTGATAQTQWGPVQVQLTVSGSKITKVTVLQYPSGNGRDTEINNYALPILLKETTSQQSAQIDMVSGATVTSTGYLQSLQSAIDKAGV
jgi:uncharacterized protein with FMN-binding domain